MPMRKRKSRARIPKIDSDDDDFELSAGDVASDLDYQEKVPVQQSAALPKTKIDTMRKSGIAAHTTPRAPLGKASTQVRKSAPA